MENTLIWLQKMEDNNESWVKISSVITMLKKEQEEAINYSQCFKSDSEQLVCPNCKSEHIGISTHKGFLQGHCFVCSNHWAK